LAGCGSKKI
jgi:hypothetical protein